MGNHPNLFFLLSVVLALFFASPAAAKFYHWVDKKGITHYSDSVPTANIRLERRIFDKQGKYLKTIEAAKTVEQRRQRAELERIQREKEKERAQHDRMLLATFSSVSELKMALDVRLATIDSSIRVAQGKFDQLEVKLTRLETEIAETEGVAENPDEQILKQAEDIRIRLAKMGSLIANRQHEKGKLTQRFQTDIERFRELKFSGASR